MFSMKALARASIGILAALAVATVLAQSQPSQVPLLTQSGSVSPNLLLVIDDSGSMNAQFLYRYGGTGGGYGMPGPGSGAGQTKASCSGTLNINTTCTYNPTSITITTSTATPSNWNNSTNYATNTFVLGSDSKVYQCQEPGGCDAGNNPTVVGSTPPTWTAQSYGFNSKVLYSPDGHVYNCTRGSGCSSSRIPGSSSRWDDLGTLAEYLDSIVQWSNPGVPLATYLAASASAPRGTGRFWELSPDVNRIAYDPRVRYRTRLTGTGSATTTAATPSATSSFFVFFYGNGGTVTPKISQLWNGTTTYGDPATYGSYFGPYTAANQATNSASTLAASATTGLSYPQCVGPCTGVAASVSNSTGPFPKFAARSDCAGNSCTLAEEQQNYATWKKFYSNRMDLAKSGLGYAFQYVDAGLRLGWAQISDLDDTATDLGTASSGVSEMSQARKTAFYNWLYGRYPNSGTPLRESLDAAGKYFRRSDNKGPWAVTPDPLSITLSTPAVSTGDTLAIRATHPSCRRSYTMLLTDGYWNGVDPGVGSISSGGTNDSDAKAIPATITGTTPAGSPLSFSYNGSTKPYAKTSTTGEMADIAMFYWITDLRTDLVNNVPTSATNPSFWQNMGFYGITLGIDGTLPQTQATLDEIVANTKSWPNPSRDNPTTVDDLWHATVNARGRLLNAKNADELSDGIEGMLAEINKVDSSQSGVAASAAALTTATRKYTPRYTTGNWSGDIIATKLDPVSAADTCIAWQVTENSTENYTLLPWCAGVSSATTGDGIPAHGSRYIYAWNGSTYAAFDSSNSFVNSNVVGANANLINFLRGDQSNEDVMVGNAITVPRLYRTRTKVLGDIVNSTPTFVGGALNMGYDKLPAGAHGQGSYNDYVALKAARTEGVLFAGANDGMLHGFRDSTGVEAFAFVPKAVMSKMHLLANRSYTHNYYVDGTTTEVDACLGTPGRNCTAAQWSNLLMGSLGAGGKEVFAIDVTNITPGATMGLSAASIKWEITSSDTGFANLGYILSDIQTGMLTDGTWVAVFGNGYYGADGKAHLYVANLDTGALIKDIDTGVGSGNGLSGPTLVLDDNKRIIGAYAGDLKGNMWKFDLTSGTSSTCCVGLSGSTPPYTPLYAAGTSKPITAPPAIVTHPNGGRVVTFGTGKLFDAGDTAAGTTQSFYGIWDSVAFGNPIPTTPAGVALTEADKATKLVQQTLGAGISGTYKSTNADLTTATVNITGFAQTKNTIDWATKRGWYLDMPASGERLIYPMASLFGRLVLAYTISPSAAADPCTQTQSGNAWSYVFDLLTGGRPDQPIYSDCPDCSKLQLPKGPIGPPVVICQNGSTGSCFALPPTDCRPGDTACNSPLPIKKFCGAQSGIACAQTRVTRTWRQLFMR
jgi:type IV pilus assembly protein PilY1